MKCPKCQYFSFDSGDRCRNCGYDFSLAPDQPAQDLPIQNGTEALGPLADFALHDAPSLPLFKSESGDPDAPLVNAGAAPRVPLAVRRPAPAVPRPKPRRESPRPELDPEPRLSLDTAEQPILPEPALAPFPAVFPDAGHPVRVVAPLGARLIGAAVDFILVAGIDLAVVYFTLKICDLAVDQVLSLPMAPMLSFLILLNGGYLSAFVAAGGQTIGKMTAGTRVIPAEREEGSSDRVTFGQAVVRAAGYLVSALPLGLGFLPAFIGEERRGLHDRLADTRVVKA